MIQRFQAFNYLILILIVESPLEVDFDLLF